MDRSFAGPQLQEGSASCKFTLKTLSVHEYTQLSEIIEMISKDNRTIIIARITPLATKDPRATNKLMDELYGATTGQDYSIFRLGDERIILTPPDIRVVTS